GKCPPTSQMNYASVTNWSCAVPSVATSSGKPTWAVLSCWSPGVGYCAIDGDDPSPCRRGEHHTDPLALLVALLRGGDLP
ncbi:MAG TPA: hypothetical protein VK140_13995, partial [Ktedonobacteraceae bacterium]|nr:hypothetical protein [Ktedonobacteraceae bacterium]